MAPSDRTERSGEDPGEASPLRLTAARGGLGIEAYLPIEIGPLSLTELSWSLPGVRFPVDLSGGVRSFHHRRGELQGVAIEGSLDALSRWLHPRTRHLLGGSVEPPSLWAVDGGVGVGLWCRLGAVAFDLLWAPDDAAPRAVVTNPRGAGFRGPALAQALFVADAMLGKFAERRGRLLALDRALERLMLTALPPLGVRAPAIGRVTLGELRWMAGAATVRAAPELGAELPEAAVRALALADLLAEGDERLSSADPEGARAAYVAALEHAPRHPEICQLVAAIDGEFADRTEASLGLLVESLPITAFGLLGAELLVRTGDRLGAAVAVNKQIESEPYAPLAALALVRLSELFDDSVDRLDPLDRALAVCPRCSPARWARLEARLVVSDVNGAVSDAEHLEASTRGSRERYEVLLAAAERIRDAGFLSAAGRLFERALRYVPKEGRAALGLAECLIATGREGRALPLVNRAVDDQDEATQSRACLVLARLLAAVYRDLPQAIARAQRVSAVRPNDAIEARALEARWREQLGDLSGARLAYGRLHELVSANRDVDVRRSAQHLLEAARFASEVASDTRSAHRHVALALRLEPKDARVQRRYRELSELLDALPDAGKGGSPALPSGDGKRGSEPPAAS